MIIQMVCPRDYVLRSRTGHTIEFHAGEPTPVPEVCYAEALAKNIVPAKVKNEDSPVFDMVSAEITGTLRDALLYGALDELAKRNQTEDFTGGGVPKAAVVSGLIGTSVSAAEVSRHWSNYRTIVAENSDLPNHPQVEVVRELQSLGTRKQLEDFAHDHDLGAPKAKGKSVKEFKELLLHSVIHQMPVAPDPGEYQKPATLMED